MTPLVEGLRISMVGLALVFAALGVLILLLYLLRWISDQLLESHASATESAAVEQQAIQVAGSAKDELARVAVMAVALLRARQSQEQDRSLGDLLQEPASEWWVGRHHGARGVLREREA